MRGLDDSNVNHRVSPASSVGNRDRLSARSSIARLPSIERKPHIMLYRTDSNRRSPRLPDCIGPLMLQYSCWRNGIRTRAH